MTPTPPSALLLAAAEAVLAALAEKTGWQWGCGATHRGVGTPDCPREPHHHHDERCFDERDILAALRPLLEDRLAAMENLEALCLGLYRPTVHIKHEREGYCVTVWHPARMEPSSINSAPTLASAIAAARVTATPTKESEA